MRSLSKNAKLWTECSRFQPSDICDDEVDRHLSELWKEFLNNNCILKFQQHGHPQTLELMFISKRLALSKIAKDPN